MVERFYIGPNDGDYWFRVSRPGHDVKVASDDQLVIKEDMRPLIPKFEGSAFVNAGSSAGVTIPATFTTCPFILLRASDETVPGFRTFSARFTATNSYLLLYNYLSRAITIHYYIFDEVIP